MRAFLSRTWGDYHRFLAGRDLEPGERELQRWKLQGISVYVTDRHTALEQESSCILTDRRLLARGPLSGAVQVPLNGIAGVRAYRDHDSDTGFSYWVVIDRAGSDVHDVRGDVCLQCENQEQSQELASLIGQAAETSRRR